MSGATVGVGQFQDLVRSLDEALEAGECASVCACVKAALEQKISRRQPFLMPVQTSPCADQYARHLVHRDPLGRYTVVAMVWGPGQGTPLHDHAQMWCVECVYEGRITVTSYDLASAVHAEPLQFVQAARVVAGVGEAGALIPPFEYHKIENPFAERAVTLHVYGGEMQTCNVFLPRDGGGWRREVKTLCYSS